MASIASGDGHDEISLRQVLRSIRKAAARLGFARGCSRDDGSLAVVCGELVRSGGRDEQSRTVG